jgi:hypothetical protein
MYRSFESLPQRQLKRFLTEALWIFHGLLLALISPRKRFFQGLIMQGTLGYCNQYQLCSRGHTPRFFEKSARKGTLLPLNVSHWMCSLFMILTLVINKGDAGRFRPFRRCLVLLKYTKEHLRLQFVG